jgi:hypothetical protein
MLSKNSLSSLLVLASLAGAASASAATIATDNSWCGTHRNGMAVATAIHRDSQRRIARGPALKASLAGPEAIRAGNIAVLVDDGSIIRQPNPFDLADTGLQFTRKKKAMVASRIGSAISPTLGTRLDLTDDSSILVPFPKGFRVMYFGKTYSSMFVNSDGNLTFVEADFQSTERSPARFLNGPPRIAPFFADLDPEHALEGGGIFLLASKTKIVVTWVQVPEFGRTAPNTFQVTILKNGNVSFAYGEISGRSAIAGVSPGFGGRLELVDYETELPTPAFTTALAEIFDTQRQLDDLAIANAFFTEFADDYDHLIVWLDFSFNLGGGAFAYEFTLKNEIRGIGVEVFDASAFAGSAGRLRSFVQMGNLGRYPADPNQELLGTNTTMDVLGQETGHRWLAFLTFRNSRGAISTSLLGRDLSHWSFSHDSLGSDMEGNGIRDDGGGVFTTVSATERFSPLDQYAMGLIPASDVPPFFYVADSTSNAGSAPQIGVEIRGQRTDVRIEDVIAAEGARVPSSASAPKTFNMAFVMISAAGTTPNQASIDKLERYRSSWETYFAAAVDNHGGVDTTLRP